MKCKGMVPNSGGGAVYPSMSVGSLSVSAGGRGAWRSEGEDINESQRRPLRPNCAPDERDVNSKSGG